MTKFTIPVDKFLSQPTPFYYYSLPLLEATLSEVNESSAYPGFKVHYAIKANANPEILKVISRAGLGADVVSGGEIRAAVAAGFPADKIVFAGVGKSDVEIITALEAGISCFNVESLPELEVISALALERGKVAKVALRVNPNIDAHTHHYITTGLSENKFGISLEMLPSVVDEAVALKGVELIGLHFHIGSQLTDMKPFEMLCDTVNRLNAEFNDKGIKLQTLNVGGGLGIDYNQPDLHPIPDFKAYFKVFADNLKLLPGQELHFELGRAIVGQCGSLITRVLYVKQGLNRKFAIVDAGFTELIRPALYQAHHKIENLTSPDKPLEKYDVVGPICESSDCFGKDELLPEISRGDILALRSAGAYGEVMASTYNCRTLPPSLLI
ncbi:MAG: diaminopimelate decarboxylase [Paramuribaculum sp.]|nr:diaminopimelate decarboxylase [Paramuribaculum sp.]